MGASIALAGASTRTKQTKELIVLYMPQTENTRGSKEFGLGRSFGGAQVEAAKNARARLLKKVRRSRMYRRTQTGLDKLSEEEARRSKRL